MSKLVLTVPALLHEIVVIGFNLFGGHIGRVAYGVIVLAETEGVQCLREVLGYR